MPRNSFLELDIVGSANMINQSAKLTTPCSYYILKFEGSSLTDDG